MGHGLEFSLSNLPFMSSGTTLPLRCWCMAADRHTAIALEKKTKGTKSVLDSLNVSSVIQKRSIYPRCSMYGIFTPMWLTFMKNVGIYSIHGGYGYCKFFRVFIRLAFCPWFFL